tara:strand:- start:547 stop:1275 length:729 start_codon:yes stop_codon:yes gene_type:complete
MSIIAVAAAGLAVVSAGSSLYNQYKQGSTLENTDWSGLSSDVTDMFTENLSGMRDRADVVFEKIDDTWENTVKGIGQKADTLWDAAQEGGGNLVNFGEEVYQTIVGEGDLDREADMVSKDRDLKQQQAQLSFEQEELALNRDMESQVAELNQSDESSKGWYPGKYIGKLFSDVALKRNIDLVGKSPSGINIYEFNYRWEKDKRHRGVMAHEIMSNHSNAISKKDGYLMVDYSLIDVDFKEVA